ncbi:ATP-binding protein [Marinobacter sp. MDS2]|uniref:ATP-binding protein n=1 Tax=Marinobacter sp. MDS2 TaxID=3065961 RepID=UPI00273C31FE|nr:ATP-binding protein [Marinobacter sp. MDS2]MDP4547679.1 ATP-binding protein [Marinobacter sp. MDS2]
MSLKRQLFLASVLMLLIPWAGLKFVLELDNALRAQALQQLEEKGARLAELAGDFMLGAPVVTSGDALYADSTTQFPKVDGFTTTWPGFRDHEEQLPWQSRPGQENLRWLATSNNRYLYLLVQKRNQGLRPFNPSQPEQPHDRVELVLVPPPGQLESGQPKRWLIRTTAPGTHVPALIDGNPAQTDRQIEVAWEDLGSRWQLELRMPLPAPGSRLGFQTGQPGESTDTEGTSLAPPPLLVQRNTALERALARQLSNGQQATLLEPAGWIAAHSQTENPVPATDFDDLSASQILEQITLNVLRSLVRLYQPKPKPLATTHHQLHTGGLPEHHLVQQEGTVWLATEHTFFGGRTLFLKQSMEQLLSVSGSALGSVLARSLLIILALTLALLGYASWLSWRIARLQQLVSASVDDDGRILEPLPPARSRDELGQLQQHFGHMVSRLQSYNHYLESFSRKLSHELKTPVAVVRSSLENLAHSHSEQERQQYLERASSAAERLRRILNSMSEAARLEQSFDQADKEHFDLAEVVSQACAAYQQVDPHHQHHCDVPDTPCPLFGSPEMLVQMLDKLVDNARDFTPEGGGISVRLEQDSEHYIIEVFNEGSSLPVNPGVDIFGAFVSQREGKAEGHLGQGLLIVRLIAEFHSGRIDAQNQYLNGIDGVAFRVIIPRLPHEPRTAP